MVQSGHMIHFNIYQNDIIYEDIPMGGFSLVDPKERLYNLMAMCMVSEVPCSAGAIAGRILPPWHLSFPLPHTIQEGLQHCIQQSINIYKQDRKQIASIVPEVYIESLVPGDPCELVVRCLCALGREVTLTHSEPLPLTGDPAGHST